MCKMFWHNLDTLCHCLVGTGNFFRNSIKNSRQQAARTNFACLLQHQIKYCKDSVLLNKHSVQMVCQWAQKVPLWSTAYWRQDSRKEHGEAESILILVTENQQLCQHLAQLGYLIYGGTACTYWQKGWTFMCGDLSMQSGASVVVSLTSILTKFVKLEIHDSWMSGLWHQGHLCSLLTGVPCWLSCGRYQPRLAAGSHR